MRKQKDIKIICDKLDISQADYARFKRIGNSLHRQYEIQCNGPADAMGNWDEQAYNKSIKKEERLEEKGRKLADKIGVEIYYQTDPRGATVYLSRQPLSHKNYNSKGWAIY